MQRWHRKEILSDIIQKYGFNYYIELGLRDPKDTFDHIPCGIKRSVDINPGCKPSFVGSTDDFFKQMNPEEKFDIVLIDAYHSAGQVYRDLLNSLKHINDDGIIVLHDTLPQRLEHTSQNANGTAWKVVPHVIYNHPELHICSIPETTCGCSVVIKNKNDKRHISINPNPFYDYDYMDANRIKSQNLISYDKLFEWIEKPFYI